METNLIPRYNSWIASSGMVPTMELFEAFREGFAQALEFVSGETRTEA